MAATEMNSSIPMPDQRRFGMQMEGLMASMLYLVCAAWTHLAAVDAGTTPDLISTKVIALSLVGLIAIPFTVTFPMVLLRRLVTEQANKRASVSAVVPFARFALFGLQCLLIWVVTQHAYARLFAPRVLA